MSNIKIFENSEFGSVRTVMIDDEPWFMGKDVAVALGYAKPENAIANHVDKEDKTTTLIQGTGSNYKSNAVIINESGLYSLVLSSKLPSARRFKHWVTSEVLPSIRKTGSYELPQTYAEALRALADKAEEAERLEKQNTLLISDNERMKPKEEFFDAVTDSKDAIDMKDTANALHMGIGRNTLFKFLREQKILTENNRPYQQFIDRGYFRVIEQRYDKGYGETGVNIKTVVFQKGVDFIRKLIKSKYINSDNDGEKE